MAIKKDVSAAKKGMQRDKHPAELSKEEYSFMINGNFQNEHGDGPLILQNEPSNIFCTGFIPGYKVIGHKYDINGSRTYFFLTNPTTGCSEIGYINTDYNFDGVEAVEESCGCNISVVLENPLELTTQTAICTYTTLISDFCELTDTCTGCLNFSVDHPIFESNIHIKDEKTGKTLYWTDNFNPQRYLQLDHLDQYTETVDPCDDKTIPTCLQCDKLRVFKESEKPCLTPRVIQNGGNLRAGMYEAEAGYCDLNGNNLSDYYSLTNPIPVFDKNNNILDQTNLDYLTNQAISLEIDGLDTSYEYFKIAIIYRSGLDSAVSYFDYGVYPISTKKVTISTLVDKQTTTLQTLLSRRPFYLTSKGLAVGDGKLFQYGLTTHREINLQPVVNLLGSLVKWQTVQANEDLYENGVFISNYLSYMRDEVVPLSIKFFTGGYETANFVLIPRPPSAEELEVLGSEDYPSDTNTESILLHNPECSENNRTQRWQFENTATILGRCEVPAGGYDEVTTQREVESSCYVSNEDGDILVLDTIASSSIEIDSELDLVTYINLFREDIIASSGANGADIRDILEDPTDYTEECSPDFGDNCSEEITLVSEEMFAISVGSETRTEVGADYEDYERVQPPKTCGIYLTDASGDIVVDSVFVTNFMEVGEEVFKRVSVPTNNDCNVALTPSTYTSPQIDNLNYLVPDGEIGGGISTLRTSLTTSAVKTKHTITLTGTSGTGDIVIDGINYSATYSASLTQTATNFTTAHAAAILIASNAVATSIGPNIYLVKLASLAPTVTFTGLTGTLNAKIEYSSFTDKVHTNNLWFKLDFNSFNSTIFEVSPILCEFPDDNSGQEIRISVFDSCSATSDLAIYSRIVDDVSTFNDINKFIELQSSDFSTGSAYIVIDAPIRRRTLTTAVMVATTTPPCGCFSVFQRQAEYTTVVEYTNLTFGKKQTYASLCDFSQPVLNGCDPVPYEYGLFSHWQSELKYPCVPELFDSSNLLISPSDIPTSLQAEFESYYTSGVSGSGYYVLTSDTDFKDKPIRHYKFPCNTSVPFFSFQKPLDNQNPGAFKQSVIYPIGFFLSNEAINAFLDIAVNNGLLTLSERVKINKYEIFRADRSVDKSVIAKGLLFDAYSYTESTGESTFYPNYPLNSLGKDNYNGGVNHQFLNAGNNKFTFHSPNTHFFKPTLPGEMKIEGYQFGNAATYFDEVRGHSTYVLLGNKAYGLATTLAIAESAFEAFLQITDYSITASTGSYGLAGGIIIAVAAGIAIATQSLFKVGEYRYRWLETFRNLGKPNNFAYYGASVGYYNYFLPNELPTERLRGIAASGYINSGRWEIAEETVGTSVAINNFDREDSVFLSLGDSAYNVLYPNQYKNYDNADFDPANSSRTGYDSVGRSSKLVKNTASPYASLKQYLPSQYGTIPSIEWIHTNYCGDLSTDNTCSPIFGGDTYISRFSVKRKLPFFTSNAARLAPLIPFKYSDYFNINPQVDTSRFYLDYLTNDETNTFFSLFLFPDNKSNTDHLDYTPTQNLFYLKPPSKFYLFSYGIPYFLVESEINCNFRYAKREKFENFYPNIGDVIEFTQEENVSIKEPNTYFYNFVYSAGHTRYPYSVLPENYNEELYKGLNNLDSVVIYSQQDDNENQLTDTWLRYLPLDLYQFPTSYGKIIDLDGIESEQILGRFTNGITVFNAVDNLRDRLDPTTEQGKIELTLGSGKLFSGRNINFNKTDLGYGGTQHKAKVSCEFGSFWPDAKRGKVFNLAPNAGGFTEITEGLEKWFKENLPFKLASYFPTLNLDNHYAGVGISMGWDDRLKRVFLTKLDYKPKQETSYQEGIGFYIDTPICPEGFSFVDGQCVYEDIQPKQPTGTPLALEDAGNSNHGFSAPALYSAYNSDGTANVDGMSPTGFTYENLTDTFWTGDGVVADRLTSKFGKWVTGASSTNVWYGASSIFEVDTTKTYHVVLAADNLFRFSVDGVVILTSDYNTMGPQHVVNPALYSQVPFRKVHIYPIQLTEGCHIITIEGLNEGSDAMFGAAILDNTAQELRDATAYTDLNYVFTTETVTTFYEENLSYDCPEGYTPLGNDLCEDCLLREIEPAEYNMVELTDPSYFENCSWTVAYSPLTKMWISYYSFLPNYYVSYDNYFQTGLNYSNDNTELGLWSHFSFLSSYQVFYGKKYEWTIEYPQVTNMVNSVLQNIQFYMEVKKYYNKYDAADIVGSGFNKAVIYNSSQNSGQLLLTPQENNNARQLIDYPKHNQNSIDILVSEESSTWSFNYFYNLIKKENSGLPIWKTSCNQISKEINHNLLDYRNMYHDRLRGNYFLVRLTNDSETKYKMLFFYGIDQREFYA